MQHFLSGRQGRDIPIKHLFVEYRHWIERDRPFKSVQEELSTLSRQKDDFRRILAPTKSDPIAGIARFLEAFDTSTAYPLLLVALDAALPEEELLEIAGVLESYLLRRAVCNLTTKNYNRIFLQAARTLAINPSPLGLRQHLTSLAGDSARWPDDAEFHEAWVSASLYHILNNPKVVYLLRRLSESLQESKSEPISFDGSLTVEHLMPQNWVQHWPLRDGSSGLDWRTEADAPPDDARAAATRARNAFVHVVGNLTILTQSLNSSVSNGPWAAKRAEIMRHALLPLNRALYDAESWDEMAIAARSESLFKAAVALWSRPA